MPTAYFTASHAAPIPVDLVTSDILEDYLSAQSEYARAVLNAEGFKAAAGNLVRLPDMTGNLSRIAFGFEAPDKYRIRPSRRSVFPSN